MVIKRHYVYFINIIGFKQIYKYRGRNQTLVKGLRHQSIS